MRRRLAALALAFAVGCDATPPDPVPDWSFLDADLVAVDVLSRDHARLATAEGRVYETLDGGENWRRLEPPPDVAAPSAERFALEHVTLPFAPLVFEWRDGETELGPEARDRLTQWTAATAGWSGLVYEVEARVSDEEIARFVPEGEAMRLFEILDARLSEARGVLEESGVPPEAIRIQGAPPWELEERIDEEPGLITNYLATRRGDAAALHVGIRDERRAHAVVFAPGRAASGLAVGEHGAIWTSKDRGARWRAHPPLADAALLAAVRLGDEWLVVDEQGRIHRSRDAARSWQVAPETAEGGAPLRAIDFAPDGALGLAVGDAGRVERRRAGRPDWQPLAGPAAVSAAR